MFEGTYQGERVAIKTLVHLTPAANEELLGEAHMMARLKHKNLVMLKGGVLKGEEVMLVTEFMAKVWLFLAMASHAAFRLGNVVIM